MKEYYPLTAAQKMHHSWIQNYKTQQVSGVSVVNNGDGEFKCEDTAFGGKLSFSVEKADGAKCERCWCYSETVGENSEHPTLCKRCAEQVSKA